MFQTIASMTRWVQRCARYGWQRGAGMAAQRLLCAWRGPVQVGVELQPEGWYLVLHEPGTASWPSTPPGAEATPWSAVQYRAWVPDSWAACSASLSAGPHGPLHADQLAGWGRALQALHSLLPTSPCHLTLAWPDELLWTRTITLTGPLVEKEVPSLLEEELALVLPVPLEQVAWDARPLVQSAVLPPVPGRGTALLSWLSGSVPTGRGPQRVLSGHSDEDAAWQCWVIPRALAQHIGAVGRALGWASVGIEPRSVSAQRAMALWSAAADPSQADGAVSGAPSPEALAAWGAARRQPRQAPDLLRDHRGGWLAQCGLHARRWWPGWLAWGLAAGMGYALGGVVHERWAREQEHWTRRLRQLHATEQARQANRLALEQARTRHQEFQLRATYNQRFAQVLQGWASTVPEGVRWQQLSLRPRVIELQGQALGAESVTRWMQQWPGALWAGAQHQVHWQPEAPNVPQANRPAVWGVRVQLSWNPMQKAPE